MALLTLARLKKILHVPLLPISGPLYRVLASQKHVALNCRHDSSGLLTIYVFCRIMSKVRAAKPQRLQYGLYHSSLTLNPSRPD